MADGSRHSLYMIAETVYGTTPATPSLGRVRNTGTTLGTAMDTLESEEIRSDRQTADFRLGQRKVGGGLPVEVAADAQFDLILEALLGGTWTTNVLKAGTTRRSFAVLRRFEDLAGTEKAFQLFNGVEWDSMDLKCGAGQIAKCSFEAIALKQTGSLTGPTGAVYGSPTTTPPMDAFTGAVTEGGSANGVVTEVGVKLSNNLERRFVIGSEDTLRPGIGRCEVDGTLSAYFENTTLYDKFLGKTDSSLSFQLTAGAKSYTILLPKIKYTAGNPDVAGEGSLIVPFTWKAVFDSTEATNIKITRVP